MAGAPTFAWPASYQAAVSLTYDDGLPIHYTLAGPFLERYNLRTTFYTPHSSFHGIFGHCFVSLPSSPATSGKYCPLKS